VFPVGQSDLFAVLNEQVAELTSLRDCFFERTQGAVEEVMVLPFPGVCERFSTSREDRFAGFAQHFGM
jgi:hypothetical protein